MNKCRLPHITLVKNILIYLKGTLDLDLFFHRKTKQNEVENGVVLEAWYYIGAETKLIEKIPLTIYSST